MKRKEKGRKTQINKDNNEEEKEKEKMKEHRDIREYIDTMKIKR